MELVRPQTKDGDSSPNLKKSRTLGDSLKKLFKRRSRKRSKSRGNSRESSLSRGSRSKEQSRENSLSRQSQREFEFRASSVSWEDSDHRRERDETKEYNHSLVFVMTVNLDKDMELLTWHRETQTDSRVSHSLKQTVHTVTGDSNDNQLNETVMSPDSKDNQLNETVFGTVMSLKQQCDRLQ